MWDVRSGSSPVAAVPEAHGKQDVHCINWSLPQPNDVVTGEPCLRALPALL